MNKFQKFVTKVNTNRRVILKQTAIIGVSIVGVTLISGLISVRVKPSEEAVDLAEVVADAVKKATR